MSEGLPECWLAWSFSRTWCSVKSDLLIAPASVIASPNCNRILEKNFFNKRRLTSRIGAIGTLRTGKVGNGDGRDVDVVVALEKVAVLKPDLDDLDREDGMRARRRLVEVGRADLAVLACSVDDLERFLLK